MAKVMHFLFYISLITSYYTTESFSPQITGLVGERSIPVNSIYPHTTNSNSKRFTKYHVILHMSTTSSSSSDAEALLAKARALRQQAEAEEHKLHTNLIEKRNCQNVAIDNIIQQLFPLNEPYVNEPRAKYTLAKRIDTLKLSSRVLENVIERLHEREIAARGLEHVEPSKHHDQVKFVRVAAPQEEELGRVKGLIQRLIDAAEVLDDQYLKNEKKEKHHHVDSTHWSRGTLSKVLKDKAHFLGREHDEEFKRRLEEYYEAARKKKDHDSFTMY